VFDESWEVVSFFVKLSSAFSAPAKLFSLKRRWDLFSGSFSLKRENFQSSERDSCSS